MWKPKVFVGSSSEGKDVAKTFCTALKDVARALPWWVSPEFEAMHSTLDGLLTACNLYDFGLFIMTPDDRIESRGEKQSSARDNVLFEIGLFLGRLGDERVFVFVQEANDKNKRVKMPSDLAGIVIPRFSNFDRYDLIASVEAAAGEYGKLIQYRGPRFGRIKLVKTFDFDSSSSTFIMKLDPIKIKDNRRTIEDNRLVVVARKFDNSVAAEEDSNIAIGEAKRISKLGNEGISLSVDGSNVFTNLHADDRIDAYLLLVPDKFDLSRAKSLSRMLDEGCDIFDRYGRSVGVIRAKKPSTPTKRRKNTK